MKEYLQSQDDVISSLGSSREGLSTEEAKKRLSEYGPNKLEEKKKDSIIKKFFEELSDPMLIILMIAYSGARVSEILELNFKDISIDGEYYLVRLHGKGNKMRTVYILRKLIEHYFNAWIAMRSSFPNAREEMPLFINRKLNVPAQSYIYVIIENLLANIGIRKAKNGAHLLRHSFATMLYTKSKDLILVQESLGHSSIETSRIYTHFDNNKLKNAANVISNIES